MTTFNICHLSLQASSGSRPFRSGVAHDQPGEQVEQGSPLCRRERVEVGPLTGLEELGRLPLRLHARVRERDRTGTPIARITTAAHVAALLELVDALETGYLNIAVARAKA
jgi:hypothetical protein